MSNPTYHPYDAAKLAVARGADRFFEGRLADMIFHVCHTPDRSSHVTDLRVAKGWPARGSVMFTRCADGQRFRAYLKGRTFSVRPVKGA